MRKLKERICNLCNTVYQPTGSCSKFCDNCKKEAQKAYQRKAQMDYRRRIGKPVGVGKGGSNKKGSDHPQYKTGSSFFDDYNDVIKAERRFCERCGKDLINASRYFWCVHHKDHNHNNNVIENFELLCKSCHQKEHNAADHLNK